MGIRVPWGFVAIGLVLLVGSLGLSSWLLISPRDPGTPTTPPGLPADLATLDG